MTKQDTLIWDRVEEDELAYDYHKRQFQTPYRSTVLFFEFLGRHGFLNDRSGKSILDLGSGMGANICYGARRHPDQEFVGVDLNGGLVEAGTKMIDTLGIANARLEVGDLYRAWERFKGRVGTVLSFQVLLSLPDLDDALNAMASTGAKTIAMSSLFTDSQVEVKCVIRDHSRGVGDRPYFPAEYNVYPLDLVRSRFAALGYTQFVAEPFVIDIDLPRQAHRGLATFTEKTVDGEHLQFSGPIFMPWYFVAATMPD